MRIDLRLDLKDSGALWSDAELNRCVERAVADLSRFLPRERVYEEVLDFTVTGESVTMPLDAVSGQVVAVESLANTVLDGDLATVDGQPDVPRPLRYLLTDADDSITSLTIVVTGTDENDLAVEEVFSYVKGDDKLWMGKKYFKAVYSVEFREIAGNAAPDQFELGIGAYTDVWVSLAYKPIKWKSETSVTDVDANAVVRGTDFEIDYVRGKIKAISGGDIVAADTVTISYIKNQTHIDLSGLADFIRVHRTEYPVGDIPQSFCQTELFGRLLSITGLGESEEQQPLQDGKQVRVQYDAFHQPPNDYTPGTIPEFLENTIIQAAAAYALFVYALKAEHQALMDLTTARTAVAAAESAQTALSTALTNIKKYLDNNSDADAAGVLADITTDVANLRTAISTALDAANTYMDDVAFDLSNADSAKAKYMGAIANYVDGGTEPDVKAYLESGDALLNTIATGGEDERTPEVYATFAQIAKNALVAAHEQDRKFFQQDATARTNAALGYVQEAAQRLANLRTYMEQANSYTAIASVFAREAETRAVQVESYLREAAHSIETAGADLSVSDRFRTEALERRNEVWGIWRDRKEYIGDFASSAMLQMKTGNDK